MTCGWAISNHSKVFSDMSSRRWGTRRGSQIFPLSTVRTRGGHMIHRRVLPILAFLLTAVLLLPTVSLAQLRVISSGGFAAAYREALPEFERTAGVTVTTTTGASQ